MALVLRIYFNAVFGALGGLLGWLLFGVFGDKTVSGAPQWLLGGAFIGGSIGYLVVGVEALRDRSLARFCRLASYGLVVAAAGGALGMWLGEHVNYQLVGRIMAWQGPGRAGGVRSLAEAISRGLGWMFLGLAVGMSEGFAARSLHQFRYGTIGGALGGFVGGLLYGLMKAVAPEGATDVWGPAVGLVILGACIGGLSALVQGVFQPASVRVLRGWQEGREYPLIKPQTVLGRDEHADIALFRDMLVQKMHAVIERTNDRFNLVIRDSAPDQTRVNDVPVRLPCPLQDGDRIQLGNVILRFQLRVAAARKQRQASDGQPALKV